MVVRAIDADADDLLDALTEFAVRNDLEVDRSDAGEGTLFRPRREWTEGADHLFRGRDTLRVVVTPLARGGCEIMVSADMSDLHARGDAWRRGTLVRGAVAATVLIGAGVVGITHGFNPGDLIPIGIGAVVGSRSVRGALGERESREVIVRDAHNVLERLIDEFEEPS